MIRRISVPLIAATALLAAAPTAAQAAKFRGESSQNRFTTVKTGADGLLSQFRIKWRSSCRKGTVRTITKSVRPHDESTPDLFRDAGTYRVKDKDGARLRFSVDIAGNRVSESRWEGTFSARVVVKKNGRWLDTCELKPITWSADLVG